MTHDLRSVQDAPILILGAHRSGTSATAGLLVHAGGLRIGEPLPPSPANPKGYFESAQVVKAHNDALRRLDRDWSCPPVAIGPDPLAEELLAAEVDMLAAEPGPWGVKDPRLLFMLPLWCDVVDSMRLVGVVRDHESTARSLVRRDGVRPHVADEITRAHLHRLRLLRDRLDFPIVDFTIGEGFMSSARTAALALGLPWNEDAAVAFHDDELRSSAAQGHQANDDVEALLAHVATSTAPVLDSATVRAALLEVAQVEVTEEGPVTRLSLHTGLQTARRRRRARSQLPRELRRDAVELARSTHVAMRGEVTDAPVFECSTMGDLLTAINRFPDNVRALVAADFATWVAPNQLEAFLGVLAESLPAGGVTVLATSRADREAVQRRGRTVIEFDDLVSALDADHRVVDTGRDETMQWVRALVRDRPRTPRPVVEVPASEWEIDWKARHDEVRAELEQLRSSRLVRAALGVGRAASPVVKGVRRTRTAVGRGRRS